jgi:hypothetical protein
MRLLAVVQDVRVGPESCEPDDFDESDEPFEPDEFCVPFPSLGLEFEFEFEFDEDAACPASVVVSLFFDADAGVDDGWDVVPADAPSSRTPSPLLHAVSVSVAIVIAAAASVRVRVVRADMSDPPDAVRALVRTARPSDGSGVLGWPKLVRRPVPAATPAGVSGTPERPQWL